MGGLTYTTGKIGQAFNFNGTNAYVQLPNNTSNYNTDISFSFWVNFNNITPQFDVIMANYFNISTYGYGWYIIREFGNIRFSISLGDKLIIYRAPIPSISNNTWYNIVITRKYGVETKIYVNGSSKTVSITAVGTVTTPYTRYEPTYQSNQLCDIGSISNGGGDLLEGKLDAINVWNKVLTQSEITELYNSGAGKQYPF
jgi:hypothetical protein